MLKKIILLFLLLYGSFLYCQNVYSSDEFKISFYASENLKCSTEIENTLIFENDNISVEIEIVPIDLESKRFIKSQKKGAKEMARDFGLKSISKGGPVPKIENAYFVKAYDIEDGEKYPIFVIAALNHDLKVAYEITIDCYNRDESQGLKIINSLAIIK